MNDINYYICIKFLFPAILDSQFSIIDNSDGKGQIISIWNFPDKKPTEEQLKLIWKEANLNFLLSDIKLKVTEKLESCDWTHLADHPLSEEKQKEWKDYRAKLRTFVDECDPHDPIWPQKPFDEQSKSQEKRKKILKEGS